jgi:hypothetical protein
MDSRLRGNDIKRTREGHSLYVIPAEAGIQKETTQMFLRKNGFLINSRHEKMDSHADFIVSQ